VKLPEKGGMPVRLVVITLCFMMVVGCTKYASTDDLQELERAKSAATSAEKQLKQLRFDESDLKQTLMERQDSLEFVKDELETVKSCAAQSRKGMED